MIVDILATLLREPYTDLGVGKGLTRSMHAAALIERTYDVYFNSDNNDERSHSFFHTADLETVARRLAQANLQPEESRFRDILQWKNVDKRRLRAELRSNFARLLRERPEPHGRKAIEMHVIFDMRMSFNAEGYVSVIEERDLQEHQDLASLRVALAAKLPGLQKEKAA